MIYMMILILKVRLAYRYRMELKVEKCRNKAVMHRHGPIFVF